MKRRLWISVPVLILAGIAVGFLLLAAVYALPVEPMAANLRASIPAFNGQWDSEDSYEQLVEGYITTQLDNSTDAAMLLAAVHQSDASPFVQAAEAKRYIADGDAWQALMAYGEGEALESVPIARYWHGYLLALKPLLMVMSYMDIRMLLMLLEGFLLCAVIAGLCRCGLGRLCPAFALSMLAVTPAAAGFSMQFSTAFVIFLGAMSFLLYAPRRWFEGNGLGLFFAVVGITTSYIDYLTYPIATFGMPLILCLFLFPAASIREQIRQLVVCGVCWAAGYLGMWAGKWLLGALLSSEPWFWSNLMAKITERSSGEVSSQAISYLDVLFSVLRPFCKRAYLLVGVLAGLVWAGGCIRRRRISLPALPQTLALIFAALLPFGWYLFTMNHTYNHAFFTSRGLVVFVFALGALLSNPALYTEEKL